MRKIIRKVYKKLIGRKSIKSPYSCPVCKNDNIQFNRLPDKFMKKFDNAGFQHSIFLFETLNLFQYGCGICGAPDRDRLYTLYIEDYLKSVNTNEIKLLDIAPTKYLMKYLLKTIPKENYRTADLLLEDVDDNIDIQDMNIYEDNSWDFIICSHVLEHVPDDFKAMKELYRVLKPGGKAILMAPVNLGLEKSVEADINKTYTDQERWKYFGQDDHMRLYSKEDFVNRLTSSGFKLEQLDIDYFGKETFARYGINKKSVLYIGEKL